MACIHYVVMIRLSEPLILIELVTEHMFYLYVWHLQVTVKSHGQHTFLYETMKSSKPKFYANEPFSSQVLCCKYYISMYLDEYLAKFCLSATNPNIYI